MRIEELKQKLAQDKFLPAFETLYGKNQEALVYQKARYEKAVERFLQNYPERDDIFVFSAPG